MYAELEQKVCPRCRSAKEKKEFGNDRTTSRGISSWCRPCKKSWRSKRRKDNPEKSSEEDFASDLKRNYGITVEQYGEMHNSQKGHCACCGAHESRFKRGLHVDHDHRSGQVRALLCTRCNPGLGYFDDSVDKLKMAIAYLEKFKK